MVTSNRYLPGGAKGSQIPKLTTSISIIQRSQSKILRMIVDAPWYVSNAILHADLGISYVQEVIQQKCNKHHTRLGKPAPQNTAGKRRKQTT
jgi:hypothetical protein